ncbi:hypothetical protein DPMN_174622 [Dreissena polymorpha]|uniref:Cytochrome b5 n=1 Tax=Dreissena polymorpha TaxID=45954 RepID=A0A9D4E6P6_DREPO|nr:hypothetical protein DPMN_174622 [Dreissena polymorpha]
MKDVSLVEAEPDFETKLAPVVHRFTLEDVSFHSDASSCWIVIADKVYDVTEFLHTHPGGEEIILENAGSDATISFQSKGHSASAVDMMAKYCIGELVQATKRLSLKTVSVAICRNLDMECKSPSSRLTTSYFTTIFC